jgi:hypothetical protein
LGPTPVPSCDLGVTGEYERLRSHSGRARAATSAAGRGRL